MIDMTCICQPEILLLSIKPRFAQSIYSGEKIVELRRKPPKRLNEGSIVCVYESTPIQSVTGAFIVDKVIQASVQEIWKIAKTTATVTQDEFNSYFLGTDQATAIYVKESFQFDRVIELDEIGPYAGSIRAPQSYRYLNKDDLFRSTISDLPIMQSNYFDCCCQSVAQQQMAETIISPV